MRQALSGCGSERLFAKISMAALHVLIERGTRIVIPPPFLCCGFPHHANAQVARHDRIVLRDSIIVMLTNCPSCLQGLGRHGGRVHPRHIVVELARLLSGDDWLTRFRQQAARAMPIRF